MEIFYPLISFMVLPLWRHLYGAVVHGHDREASANLYED